MGTNQVLELGYATYVDVLRRHASQIPDHTAITFYETKGTTSISFKELDRKARAVAAWLQRKAAPGDRAVLVYEQSIDYMIGFFGCLYAGVLGVPAFPPRPNKPTPRLAAILEDSKPAVFLTNTPTLALVEGWVQQFFTQQMEAGVHFLATDTVEDGLAEAWQQPMIDSDDVAYLQYTSGSTSLPKGVELTHRNILANCQVIRDTNGLSEEIVAISWLPLFHDMGLIGMILAPLMNGGHAVLMSPLTFLQDPFRWLQCISTYGGMMSSAPNFAYDLCVQYIKPEKRKQLDLSSWRISVSGGEPVREATLQRFYEAFRECGLREGLVQPGYGLAEATLAVTGGLPAGATKHRTLPLDRRQLEQGVAAVVDAAGHNDAVMINSCGTWQPEVDVRIANKDTFAECAPGHVGEIWVGGASVAKGYVNRPEETESTFRGYLANGEGPYLRTGDLGFTLDGELYWTGRLKDLIIVDGLNHYPQDIEQTVEKHPALRTNGTAAFSIEVDDQEKLCLLCEVDAEYLKANPEPDYEVIRKNIRTTVAAQHEMQVHRLHFVPAGDLPRTDSGKLQRNGCRQALLADQLEILA